MFYGNPVKGIISSDHMMCLIDPNQLEERITLAAKVLQTIEFDTIAFRGMSGAFLGPSLALLLDKQMILVRKAEDSSHSWQRVEGNLAANRYVIVDDFMSSGKTKKKIIEEVSKFAPDANFVGLLEVAKLDEDLIERTIGKGLPFPLQ